MADFIISLAHFCENHGPTPILCTQVTTDDCRICDTTREKKAHSKSQTRGSARRSSVGVAIQPPLSQLQESPMTSATSSALSSPSDSPPSTPHSPMNSFSNHWSSMPDKSRRASSVSSRLTSSLPTSAPDSCANCWLALPKNFGEKLHGQAPTLRTREAFTAEPSPGPSEESSIRRSKVQSIPVRSNAAPPKLDTFQASSLSSSATSPPSPTSFSSIKTVSTPASSLSSLPPLPHAHTRTYLTTHSPQSPKTYTTLRNSCIRTLITETLPTSISSGPLLFGDHESGFTIAYIFRVRDPINRGGRRGPYALLCLGGRDETRIMRAMPTITRVFQRLAQSISTAVDDSGPEDSPDTNSTFSDSFQAQPFLRRRREYETRPKGLDELVGREDFFVEVHAVFVKLLCVLGRAFGSANDV